MKNFDNKFKKSYKESVHQQDGKISSLFRIYRNIGKRRKT